LNFHPHFQLSTLKTIRLPQALAEMCKFYYAPHGKPVGTVVVVHVRAATVEVHVVGVRSIVHARTPVVTVVTSVVQIA
jgi:hypothetical protein